MKVKIWSIPNQFFFKVKRIIYLLNVHYNGLIVITKIQYVLQTILFRDGGTHLAGFRGALTRSIVNYINKNTKNSNNVSGEDARGLTCIISVKLQTQNFQVKLKISLFPLKFDQ